MEENAHGSGRDLNALQGITEIMNRTEQFGEKKKTNKKTAAILHPPGRTFQSLHGLKGKSENKWVILTPFFFSFFKPKCEAPQGLNTAGITCHVHVNLSGHYLFSFQEIFPDLPHALLMLQQS